MPTNHNLCASDVIFLVEARLLIMNITPNEIFRNDQTWNSMGTLLNGLVVYVKDGQIF